MISVLLLHLCFSKDVGVPAMKILSEFGMRGLRRFATFHVVALGPQDIQRHGATFTLLQYGGSRTYRFLLATNGSGIVFYPEFQRAS